MRSISVAILLLFLSTAVGFLPLAFPSRGARVSIKHGAMYSQPEDFTEEEVRDMRDLVLSLSLEPTDESRRERVQKVMDEALAKPNGTPQRFASLFDMVLIKIGDEVQSEAKKKFFENKDANQNSQTLELSTVEEDEKPKEKSPEEFQLWALVDMMVQSKTIVKKESGDLGSKGTFQ